MRLYCFILFVLLAFAASYSLASYYEDVSPTKCETVPPALWCSCKKLAKECGFLDLCERFTSAVWNEPVHLTVLYESLCPDCQNFIINYLYPFYTQANKFIRVELVPFGNAQVKNGTVKCQHGPKECEINRYHSCAIHFMHDPLPFIYCLEKSIQHGKTLEKAATKCYKTLHTIPHIYDQIVHCINSTVGERLQLEAAERTMSVWPDKKEHVPWVLFNNASVESHQFMMRDLTLATCQFYNGDEVPPFCAGLGKINKH